MLAVIFEFWTDPDHADIYWSHANAMSELVKDADGFISIERFQSVSDEGKYVSLSFWRDEAAIEAWRNRIHTAPHSPPDGPEPLRTTACASLRSDATTP